MEEGEGAGDFVEKVRTYIVLRSHQEMCGQ